MPAEDDVPPDDAANARKPGGTRGDAVAVLIADADASTRAGVRISLEGAGFAVCAEAEDRPGAVDAAVRERPALCLLDTDLPGGGIAAAAEVAAELLETRIVMLTAALREEDLCAALRAGAVGYLVKDINPERLPPALRGVLNGEAAVPRALVARMLEEFPGRQEHRRLPRVAGVEPNLTEREWDVLLLLREGLRTAEMAERLGVSPVTVRRHVGEIVRKLGVADRAGAVRLLDEVDDER